MADDKNKLPSASTVFKYLSFLPMPFRILAVLIVSVIGIFLAVVQNVPKPAASSSINSDVFFASWNVANFFDDENDPANHDEDEDFYANNPDAFRKKVSQLADGLLQMNDGRGPDILAMVEVESERCLTALRDAVNQKLEANGKADQKYTDIIFRADNSGRRFAPAVLSRIRFDNNRSARFGARSNGRLLITRAMANGKELVVIAAHWTSRVSDKDGSRRASYAQDTYGQFREIVNSNPDADVIVCGDFNDEFQDISMQKFLKASDDAAVVKAAIPPGQEPLMLDLGTSLPRGTGTLCYDGKKMMLDHICVSRGMLDEQGWSYVPDSVAIFSNDDFAMRNGCPRGFSAERGTGFSDHFPIVMKMRVK